MKQQTTHNAEYMKALFQGILGIVARPDYLACDTAKLELIKEFAEVGIDGVVVGTGIEDFDDVIADLDRIEAKHSFDKNVLTWAKQNEQRVEAEALGYKLRMIAGAVKSQGDVEPCLELINEAEKSAFALSESIRDTIEPVQNPKELPF